MDEYGDETFWLTKHALTRGIEKVDRCRVSDQGDGRQYACRSRYGFEDYVFEIVGRDAFATEAEAKARVKVLIENKIKGLDKQKTKLLRQLGTL